MDLKPKQVKRSKLCLEARHSKSIEASNKIRSGLRPRLFIPRIPYRNESLLKPTLKGVTSKTISKFQTLIASENRRHFSDNNHLLEKVHKKMSDNILNLVRGKYTKKPIYKSIEKNMPNKTTTKKIGGLHKAMEGERKGKKQIEENQCIKPLVKNCEEFLKTDKKAIENNPLPTKNSAASIQQSYWKSMHEKFKNDKKNLDISPLKDLNTSSSNYSPPQVLFKQNSNEQVQTESTEKLPQSENKNKQAHKFLDTTNNCFLETYPNGKEQKNTPETQNSFKNDEPDGTNLTHNGEFLKNNTQFAKDYIKEGDFNVYWKENCKKTLSITENCQSSHPSSTGYSINNENISIYAPQVQANNTYEENFKNFYKNTTMVTDLLNVVRDSISHLHNTSPFDLQINENLISLENSVNDFSKYLLKISRDIEEMEEQRKQDLIHIENRDFKNLAGNKRRFQQESKTIASSKSSSTICELIPELKNQTENHNSDDTIAILIQADQVPAKTITFKKSEIMLPYAKVESEIYFKTPARYEIFNKTLQKNETTQNQKHESDITILSNIKLPKLDLQNLLISITQSQEQKQSQIGLDQAQAPSIACLEFPTNDLQERMQLYPNKSHIRTASKIEQSIQDTQTNFPVNNNRDTRYNQFHINMPESCLNSQNRWRTTETLELEKESPYNLKNSTEIQISNQRPTTTSNGSIQKLINFRKMPRNNEEVLSFQQQSNNTKVSSLSNTNLNQFSVRKSSQTKRMANSKRHEKDHEKRKKQEKYLKHTTNRANNISKPNTHILPDVGHYKIPPSRCWASATNSASIYTQALFKNQYQSMHSSSNSIPSPNLQRELASYYPQPSFRNSFKVDPTPYNHIGSSPDFNDSPYLTTPLGFSHNPNLFPINYFQFNRNCWESLSSQPYWNSILPSFYKQTTDYNFNAPSFLSTPSNEDG